MRDGVSDGPGTSNWIGKWVVPVIGKQYYIPPDVSNHKKFAGRTAVCWDTRSSGFGMHWALLVCEGDDGEPLQGWVRTCFMQELTE